MNILIIGNGFDLAHGFPTRYKNFLKFINEVKEYCEKFKFTGNSVSDDYKKDKDYFNFLIDLDEKNDFEYINNVFELSNNNLWVKYFNTIFKDNSSYLGDTWIDFENEIAKAINYMSSSKINKKNIASKNYSFNVDENLLYFINAINKNSILNESSKTIDGIVYTTRNIYLSNYTTLKKELLKDLKDFIRCLEIYICIHINEIKPNKRITELDDIESIDAVLSFNYTNTYERLYGKDNTKYHYIHGKANKNNTIDSCQLVLGINEYSDTSDDNDTEFIQYEKFFQRIYKRNGCEYTKWIEDKYEEDKKYNIYIYGHSLDSTDADVLNEFIELENCQITIFYYDDEALEGQITNLTKIIGRKKMIDFTSGSSPKISFQKQNNTVDVISSEISKTIEPVYVQLNLLKENFKKFSDFLTSDIMASHNKIEKMNKAAIESLRPFSKSATLLNNSAIKSATAQLNSSAVKSATARLSNPAVKSATARLNNPALKSAIALTEKVENDSNDITQAAHNDYLDEPSEKENIQTDLDDMDNWDNEE